MSTQKWIAFKDKLPTEFPIYAYFPEYNRHSEIAIWYSLYLLEGPGCATHWALANLPPPPAKEPSLAEMDAKAFLDWQGKTAWASEQCAFMAGIAYERRRLTLL